ncbi:MAG TPA: glycosyltransferase family 4 protein, partial [Candidatus Goldiibacteriota bacterium]|nr:glycosyltransferase family 4 protein [Candidatus Goldiibacteriota bacterium]
LSKIPMSKNIKIITEEYDEGQMAELMRNADCFVLPSRAEGFGMIYLEAIACGIPVIATNWGGHCDFLNEQNSLLVKCKMTKAGEIQYDNAGGDGFMAEPDRDDLCDKILFAKNNIMELMEKIKNIDLKRFYWDEITREMQKYILTI